jgi:CRISPR-associated protein Cmr1
MGWQLAGDGGDNMSRKDPDIPVPAVVPVKNDKYLTQTRKYKVITPLYGGGEEPGKADSITVVRATEVRGHLRFWWRATRGGAFKGSLEKMRQREEKIWGSSGEKGKPGPSEVSVQITDWKKDSALRTIKDRRGREVEIGSPGSPWGYVAFPLRKESDKPAGSVVSNVAFSLEIKYPREMEPDIRAALEAWEMFGGIGARTRRGFGALQCLEGSDLLVPSREAAHNMIEEWLKNVVGDWPEGVPHLSRNAKLKTIKSPGPMEAWISLFTALSGFRQSRFQDRSGRPFGRSKWPEPDAIRRLTGQAARKHESPQSTLDKFPRGKFGLPIIFQFKDASLTPGDPDPCTLQGAGDYDRLASPLILRPIACSDGAVGLAAILEWEPISPSDESYTSPGGLVLTGPKGDFRVKSDLTPAEAGDIPPLNGQPDILLAFLDYLG